MVSVLVVDDERDIREAVAEVLRDEGFEVHDAPDGAEALRKLRAHRPDVVLLDLMMPGMNGWEFCAARKSEPDLSRIPVIVISALGRVSGLVVAGLALRGPDLERFRDSGRVREVERPLAIVQAERDEFGTPDEVRAALVGSRGPRRLVAVPGATHLFLEHLPALQREAEGAIGWVLGGAREPG